MLAWAVLGFAVAHRAGADVVNWIRFDGDWSVASNWSSNPLLPAPDDDAVNPTISTITHSTGDDTIKSFAGTGPFTLSGGSISAAQPGVGTFRVDSGFGFTVRGGTLRGFRVLPGASGRPVFFDFNSNSTLDNVTSDANLELGFSSVFDGAVVRVLNGLTLNGTASLFGTSVLAFQGDQTLGGTGAVVFGPGGVSQRLSVEGAGTLTIGPDIEIHGYTGSVGRWASTPGAGKLINQGRITADGPGGVVTIDPASPALSSVTNSGILEAGVRATLNLNSHVTNTPTGQINADIGGRIHQNGVEITGGTINLKSDAKLVPSGSGANYLNGVTLNGEMDLASAGGIEGVRGGLTLNGFIRIDSNSVLAFNGTQTLSGPATFGPSAIVFGNAANNRFELAGGLLTIAANVSILGKNGRVGSLGFGGGQGIENLGTISATVEGGMISVEPPLLTNRGSVSATQGGALHVTAGSVNNYAAMVASSGGTLTLAGGAVTNSGGIEARAGGVVNVDTNVTNTGQGNITVAAPDGRVNVNGARITGGRINNTQGGTFVFSNSQNNLLDGVVASGSFSAGGGGVRVVNGLTLDGNLDLSAGGVLLFQGSQRLGGQATVDLGSGPGGGSVLIEGTSTLRLAPGVTVAGRGVIGESSSAPGTTTLINEGTIGSGNALSGTLTVRADSFTNAAGGRLYTNVPLHVETSGPAINQGIISFLFAHITFSQGLTQTGGETQLGYGRVEMPGKVFRLSGGTLGGVGGVVGDVINDGGTVKLGPRIAFSIGIQGAYTQGPAGRVLSELWDESSESPQPLHVSGAATLDGTLEILRSPGFVPTPYKRYRVLTYASRSGTFAQYDGVSAGNGLVFAPDYRADGLDLVPAVLGDANLDRSVDFNDLAALAQNYNTAGGAVWGGGDFTFDGAVDFNDLAVLAQRYNTAFPAGVPGASAEFSADWAAALAQVPEPRAVLILLLGVPLFTRRRRRARSLSTSATSLHYRRRSSAAPRRPARAA